MNDMKLSTKKTLNKTNMKFVIYIGCGEWLLIQKSVNHFLLIFIYDELVTEHVSKRRERSFFLKK